MPGQPGQAELWLDRRRHVLAPVELHAEPARRHGNAACALQGRQCAQRPAGGAAAVHVRHHSLGDLPHPGRQAACAGSVQPRRLTLAAGCADSATDSRATPTTAVPPKTSTPRERHHRSRGIDLPDFPTNFSSGMGRRAPGLHGQLLRICHAQVRSTIPQQARPAALSKWPQHVAATSPIS